MKKDTVLLFVFFTVLLALTSIQLVPAVHANTMVPGVAPGQFLRYSANVTVSGNDTAFMSYTGQSQGWINFTVLSVSGVNVTARMVGYNATSNQAARFVFNIENGKANGSNMWPIFFIAANLSAGDPIYVGSNGISINETVTADYLGEQLETNHLTRSENQTNTSLYGYLTNVTGTEQEYWERKIGITLEYNKEVSTNRPDGVGGVLVAHFHERILILSAIPPPPSVPEFASLLILPLFMIATLIVAKLYKRKQRL